MGKRELESHTREFAYLQVCVTHTIPFNVFFHISWLFDAVCWPADLHAVQNQLKLHFLKVTNIDFTRAVCVNYTRKTYDGL